MQTISIKKPLKRVPNLEKMNLVEMYGSYLRLVRSGIFRDQAKMLAQFNSIEQFRLAEKLYSEI